MRHNRAGKLFGRTANQRKALLRGLVASLIKYQRIETTVSKAKETRRIAEKLVTLAKRGDLHAKRLVLQKVPNKDLMFKLFNEIAPRFADRNGGYLRLIHTRQRVNDRAEMAVLEFVDFEDLKKASKSKKGEKKAAPKKTEAKPEAKEEVKADDAEAKTAKKAPAKKKAASAKKEVKADDAEAKTEKKAPAKKKAASAKKEAKADDAEPKAAKPKAAKKAPAKKKAAPKKEDTK